MTTKAEKAAGKSIDNRELVSIEIATLSSAGDLGHDCLGGNHVGHADQQPLLGVFINQAVEVVELTGLAIDHFIRVIGNKHPVVHAHVDALFGKPLKGLNQGIEALGGKGIEQPYLDIFMGINPGEHGLLDGHHIVE